MTAISNMGLHLDGNFEYADTLARIKQNGIPAVTLILNPNDPGKAAGYLNGNVKRFAVRYFNGEKAMSGSDIETASPEAAQKLALANMKTAVNFYAPFFQYYPDAFFLYPRNEVSTWSMGELYSWEMVYWYELLIARGVKAGAGCFSYGTPDFPVWPVFEKVIKKAHEVGGAFVFHEYGVRKMTSAYDPAKRTGYHCLRYREVDRRYGYFTKYPGAVLIATENGLDEDTSRPPGSFERGGAWQNIGVTPKQYLSSVDGLGWYNQQIALDGVVCTVYADDSDERWAPYNTHGPVTDAILGWAVDTKPKLDRIGGYLSGTTQQPPVTPPPVVIPPVQEPPVTKKRIFELNLSDVRGPESFAKDDKFGDRQRPLDASGHAQLAYQWPENAKYIAHAEMYQGLALRFQGQTDQKVTIWWANTYDTKPGDVLDINMISSAEIVDGSGIVNRIILANLDGGDDVNAPGPSASALALNRTASNLTVTATGPKTTLIMMAKWKCPFRVNCDIEAFTVDLTPAPVVTPPPVEQLPTPGNYIVSGKLTELRVRAQPNTNSAVVGLLPLGKFPWAIQEFVTGEKVNGNPYWGRLTGQNAVVSAAYLLKV